VDSWNGGDAARAGITLGSDPGSGQGYNLVFHDNTDTVQFLDDQVAWGNSYAFSWSVGTWYWFELAQSGGVLYGKVWQAGTPEPVAWMFTQAGWAPLSGAAGLNGGTNSGATASFDNFSVRAAGAGPTAAVSTSAYDADGDRTQAVDANGDT